MEGAFRLATRLNHLQIVGTNWGNLKIPSVHCVFMTRVMEISTRGEIALRQEGPGIARRHRERKERGRTGQNEGKGEQGEGAE